MSVTIDNDILVAYVDGQLDAQQTARVEVALADDPEGRETVRALRENAALLRAAFNAPMNEPLPAQVLESLERAKSEPAPVRNAGSLAPWPMAIAASIAVLAIGLGSIGFISNQRVEQEIALLRAAAESDRLARAQALSEALERLVSGQSVSWENPDSGRRGSITPVRTFRSQDGQWCREYAADEWLGDKQELRRAIACREGEGLWQTRQELSDET